MAFKQLFITNPNQGISCAVSDSGAATSITSDLYQDRFGLEGKASYSFAADNFTGKLWISGASNKVKYSADGTAKEYTATAADIGANINAGNFGLTGYYYAGEGAGTTFFLANGYSGANGKRDSDGGYLQATYVLPTKTKLGVAFGRSNLDLASGESATSNTLVDKNERTTVGLYHPLTKHLNLVGEWNQVEATSHSGLRNQSTTGSLGAILFF